MDFLQLCGPEYVDNKKDEKGQKDTKITKTNFEVLHKKTNLKFTEKPVEQKRGDRHKEMEARRKTKREETLMAKRGIIPLTEEKDKESKKTMGLSLSTSKKATAGVSKSNGVNSTNEKTQSNGNANESNPSHSGDARRDQLQQWKEHKALLQAKGNKKPVFRPGGLNINNKLQDPVLPLPLPLPAPSLMKNGENSKQKPLPTTSRPVTTGDPKVSKTVQPTAQGRGVVGLSGGLNNKPQKNSVPQPPAPSRGKQNVQSNRGKPPPPTTTRPTAPPPASERRVTRAMASARR